MILFLLWQRERGFRVWLLVRARMLFLRWQRGKGKEGLGFSKGFGLGFFFYFGRRKEGLGYGYHSYKNEYFIFIQNNHLKSDCCNTWIDFINIAITAAI